MSKHNYIIGGAVVAAIVGGAWYIAKKAQVVIKDPKISVNVSPADLLETAKQAVTNATLSIPGLTAPPAQQETPQVVAPPLAPVVDAEHGTVDPAAALQDASALAQEAAKIFSPFMKQ